MSESEASVPTEDAPPTVGMRLSQARQAQGLSLGEMARQLKLSVKQVEALERDDYRSFPGELWVRGFLRNYAKSLGLNADQIIEKAGLASDTAGAVASPSGTTMPADASKERRRTVMFALAFVVLGLFVLALLGQRAMRDKQSSAPLSSTSPPNPMASVPVTPPQVSATPTPPASEVPSANASMEATTNVLAGAAGTQTVPNAESPAPVAAAQAVPEPALTAPTQSTPSESKPAETTSSAASSPTVATPPAAVGSAAAVTSAPSAPVPATPAAQEPAPAVSASAEPPKDAVEPPKPRTLRFAFTQSVDVEVRDAEGKLLLSKLQAAGSERAVRGLPPFSVAVGNVYAVTLVYRGRPVDLVSRSKNGTSAKITLK